MLAHEYESQDLRNCDIHDTVILQLSLFRPSSDRVIIMTSLTVLVSLGPVGSGDSSVVRAPDS